MAENLTIILFGWAKYNFKDFNIHQRCQMTIQDQKNHYFRNWSEKMNDVEKSKINNLKELTHYLPLCAFECTKLTLLPPLFGYQFKHITGLNLENNNLKFIPKSIGNCNQITYLYLDNNELESLPESIGNLSKLKGLHLHNNKLKLLPKSILNLSNLELLDITCNESLPKYIRKLFYNKILFKKKYIKKYIKETYFLQNTF